MVRNFLNSDADAKRDKRAQEEPDKADPVDQMRDREIHEHRPEQAEERETHTETFVFLLEEFVAYQQNRKERDEEKRRERTAALEIADDQGAEHASEAELHHPRKTVLPDLAPFAVQKAVFHDDGVLGNGRRLVADLVGKLLGFRSRGIRSILDFRSRDISHVLELRRRSIGHILDFRGDHRRRWLGEARHLLGHGRKLRRRRRRGRISLLLGLLFRDFLRRFFGGLLGSFFGNFSLGLRSFRSRLRGSGRFCSLQAFLRPAFRVFEMRRQEDHEDKGANVIRKQEKKIGLVHALSKRNGIPAKTGQERNRREKLLGLLNYGLLPQVVNQLHGRSKSIPIQIMF